MKNHPASHRRYLRSLQAALANPTESRLSIRFPPADASGPKHLMLSKKTFKMIKSLFLRLDKAVCLCYMYAIKVMFLTVFPIKIS